MILLALALRILAPQPAEPHTFQDWIAGCDNGRACQAVSLATEGTETWQMLSLRRRPEADAEPVLSFHLMDDQDLCGARLLVDGAELPVRLIAAESCAIVHPADVPGLLAALRTGRALRMVGPDGADLGGVSLSGLSAALLAIDEAQLRFDTETALIRRGTRPASVIPPPPTLPQVRMPPSVGEADMMAVDDARIAELRRATGCTIDEVGGPNEATVAPVEAGRSLILLACGSGAYNVTWIPFIATPGANGRIAIAPAHFDSPPSAEPERFVELINATWHSGERLLRAASLGRGLGDCGTRSTYAWDGARFRLVFQSTMGECRGAYDYITTWRAQVIRP